MKLNSISDTVKQVKPAPAVVRPHSVDMRVFEDSPHLVSESKDTIEPEKPSEPVTSRSAVVNDPSTSKRASVGKSENSDMDTKHSNFDFRPTPASMPARSFSPGHPDGSQSARSPSPSWDGWKYPQQPSSPFPVLGSSNGRRSNNSRMSGSLNNEWKLLHNFQNARPATSISPSSRVVHSSPFNLREPLAKRGWDGAPGKWKKREISPNPGQLISRYQIPDKFHELVERTARGRAASQR
mmetsp:Transcript_47057/g.92624  ORF Transcript_47057/g.92624 Transcript_47057/m.92624 type:complete len:239 (+) Transcript_47057:1331-2047(+)